MFGKNQRIILHDMCKLYEIHISVSISEGLLGTQSCLFLSRVAFLQQREYCLQSLNYVYCLALYRRSLPNPNLVLKILCLT